MTLADGWPPFYAERRLGADINVGQLYVAFVAAALVCGFLLVLPGFRGVERLYFLVRWTLSLTIGILIIACGLGVSWQVAHVRGNFRYKVTDETLTLFEVGLKIGLTQFNVTLEGGSQDKLNLNEQFFFTNTDDMIEKSLLRGTPFPILSVAEHFSSTRFHSLWPWGRAYWLAGHYSSYLLWTALACWLMTNVTLHMTPVYGSMFLTLTGMLLLFANISFGTVNTTGRLRIVVGHNDPPRIMEVLYGWCFWICLCVGVICVVLGVSMYIMERKRKVSLERFLLMQYDEDFADKPEKRRVSFFENVTVSRKSSSVVIKENEVNHRFRKRKSRILTLDGNLVKEENEPNQNKEAEAAENDATKIEEENFGVVGPAMHNSIST